VSASPARLKKFSNRLDGQTQRRFQARFVQLGDNPFDPRLSRVGDWRILFTVDRDALIVNIVTIDTRGQIYKHS
jgi:mRNA-degrading endonuclease RelE of RelBE toxin-antitoxin system